MISNIVKAWVQIENLFYHGVLTIHCSSGVTYIINNHNEQCILNVFCSNHQSKNYYVGSYTHIESFLFEHKEQLEHNRPCPVVCKKRQRNLEIQFFDNDF